MRAWVDNLLRLTVPPRCRCCGSGIDHGLLCGDCRGALPWNECACPRCALPLPTTATCAQCLARPPAFDATWAAFRLEAPLQRFIHALKYRADFAQAHVLGELMATRLSRRAAPLPELLIPVPLHVRRLMRRGYNQAHEIARVIGRRCHIEVAPRVAVRVRATEDQIGQGASARRRNMRQAFELRVDLSGKHIALVDDVMTTGATLDVLARACRSAGAARIEAWAAARTP